MEPIPISEIVLAFLAIASLLLAFYGVVRVHSNAGSGYSHAALGLLGIGVFVGYKSFLSWQAGVEMPDEAVYAQFGLVVFFLLGSSMLFLVGKHEKNALENTMRRVQERIEASRPKAKVIPIR